MASNASLNAFKHADAENGSQGYLMRRHRIAIRLHAGEDGRRYLLRNPCGFQEGLRSSNAALLGMEALSTATTVFCVIV